MTEETIAELAYKMLHERFNDVMKVFHQEFETKAPFGKRRMSIDEQLQLYEQLTSPTPESVQKLGEMVKEHGPDEMDKWLGKMESIKRRRELNARRL